MRLLLWISLFAAALGASAEPLRVGVSVLPLESVVRDIAGPAVEVQSLQRAGDSCSVFEPRASTISWLAGARVFLRTGVAYENALMGKIAHQFPQLAVHDLREAVELLPYDGHDHDHDHDHAGCSAHGPCGAGADPHIWMDPVRLASIADFIAQRLGEALPERAGEFSARAQAFRERALAVHARLAGQLAPYAGRGFFIYHPDLNYFAARYGLHQVAIARAGQVPTARDLHELVGQARSEGVRTIFVQPQESRRHAEIVAAAVGATLVEIDPMAQDWESNLLAIGDALARAFAGE